MFTKLLKFLPSILLILSVVLGLTISYFSDLEKSENNIISGATLDLSIEEPKEAVWNAENMLPGDEIDGELIFQNKGTIPIESLLMTIEIEKQN